MRLTLTKPIVGGRRIGTRMLIGPATTGELIKVLAGISLFVHGIEEAGRCANALLATAYTIRFLN